MSVLRIEADRKFRLDLHKRLIDWPLPGVTIAPPSPARGDELVRLRVREAGEDLTSLDGIDARAGRCASSP